jgi:ribosomal protein S12 methylthiotransferase accessory factor
MSPPEPVQDAGLRERLGVTRIARVTGLDRAGVEVACAVRPLGHVLQVSNGKGQTRAQAFAAALSEAAELWAAEQVPAKTEWGSRASLQQRFPKDEVWSADDLGSAGELVAPDVWNDAAEGAWISGAALHRPGKVWVPALAVHCPPPGGPFLGAAVNRWSSNGLAAHPDRREALLHALFEVIERDQLAGALPHGFTEQEVRRRRIADATLARYPSTHERVARLGERGFAAFLFDLRDRPRRKGLELGIPVAGALLFDLEDGPVPLTAGYASGPDWDRALAGALQEAAQSRLTDIHGAREDVQPANRDEVRVLRAWCEHATEAKALPALAPIRTPKAVIARLSQAGHRRAAVFSLGPADLGLSVVKVVVPGLRVTELL